MLVLTDGTASGTIGGGTMEYQASRLAQSLLEEKQSRFETYQLSPGEGTGMACGGSVEVYFQYFDPSSAEARESLDGILSALNRTQASWLVTEISGGGWRMGIYNHREGLRGLDTPPERLEPLLTSRGVLDLGDPVLYAEPLLRAGTVYLFGGGHVARELARILSLTDFRVVVWDDRANAARRESFPDAAAVLCGPYEDAMAGLPPIAADDYVVVMTHGHEADCAVLAQALRTPAKYIGCIGSRKKAAAVREMLISAGFSEVDTSRIHSPIGLPIGGDTPAEIAVSAAAQLIACRSGRLELFSGKERRYAAN